MILEKLCLCLRRSACQNTKYIFLTKLSPEIFKHLCVLEYIHEIKWLSD